MFHIFLVMSKSHRFPLVLILHVQKWLLFAHVNLNSFSFSCFSRSVPLPYTSCTMTLSDGIPYRSDGLSYRRTGITEALYRNGCTVYAPLRQPPPGYGVSSSQSHMVRIRTHRTSCNMQGNACRTWRRRCNPNGGQFDGYSYYLLFSIDSIARNISYITCGTIALPYAFIDSCRHFEKVIPSNPVKIPSSRLQIGD